MKVLRAVRSYYRSIHPDHHAIAGGMFWVFLFVFIGKLAGAAKEMAVAYRYGTSDIVDAYLLVFNLLNWPVAVWFSILSVVLIPLAAQQRRDSPAELRGFHAELLGLSIVIGLAGMLLAWLGIPLLLGLPWIKLSSPIFAVSQSMTPILTALVPLGILISLLSVRMLSSGRHANTLLEGVPALTILLVLISLPGGGSAPLVWATVAGYALQLVCLACLQARHRELELPRFALKSALWRPFWQGLGVMLVGQTLFGLTIVIDQFFAAHLGDGAVAKFGYATRILSLILALGATTISRATLPVFSSAQAHGTVNPRRLVARWAWLMLGVGMVVTAIGWAVAPYVVRIVFERGAFSAADTEAVSEVLRFSLFQLPFYFSAIVLVSELASKGRHGLIASTAAAGIIAKVIANAVLVSAFGLNGIAVATAVMYATTLSLMIFARRSAQ